MSNPPIPKIDEDNNLLGETTIGEAIANGWPRRVVRVFVFDTDGKMLLQKRSSTMRSYANVWDNAAGGHVDVGENASEAAQREMQEEIGLDLELTEVVSAFKHVSKEETLYVSAYKAVVSVGTDIAFVEREVQEVGWFSVEAFETWAHKQPEDFVPAFVDFWFIWRDKILRT